MWNISQAFRAELRKPNHQVASKATLLDTAFREIPDGDFFTAGADDFQDYIVDGNVDIDQTRGTRRTAELTILNSAGGFTPDGSTTDYDGKFYVNRNIRLYRGVVLAGGTTIYAPIGTFMIDVIDIITERNMSIVTLTLSDHWKKLAKSKVIRTKTYASGTPYNTIIKEQAAAAGADYPLAPVLDTLSTRTTTTLTSKLVLERGDSRGEVLKNMANKAGIDLYFNVEGRLVSNDRKNPKDSSVVWDFYSSSDMSGMLQSVRRTLSDDNLYNHVFVIGLGDPKAPVYYEKKNTDSGSVTNIFRIGDRVLIHESQTWKSQDTVDEYGQALWAKRSNLYEEILIDTICNPALEGDDVIRVVEPLSKTNAGYRIAQMNVPLTTSKQTIKLARNIYV